MRKNQLHRGALQRHARGLYAYFRGSGGRAPPPWLPHDGLSLLYPERRYCARNPFLELPGAHCRGHNKYSIGICYEGGLDARGNPRRIPVRRSSVRPCTCWCTSCYNSSGTPVYAATATSVPIWTEMGRWSRGSG